MWKINELYFSTSTGVPQGDVMTADEFTFHLTRVSKKEHQDHSYVRTHFVPQVISHYHCYPRDISTLNVNIECTDDLTSISKYPLILDQTERDLPPKLNSKNLNFNK